MLFKLLPSALVFILLTVVTLSDRATAQVQSSGLAEPDLWTVGFLSADEESLPVESWSAADTDELLALTRTARTRRLSPVEQALMRRLVLSAAEAPENAKSDQLLAERARLMFQIGEASAAAQLFPSLKIAPAGLDTDEVAVDLQLAIGQTEAACLEGAGEGREGVFWVKLRAVCFALEDRFEEAEFAMELAGAQGMTDTWLTKAIFAASGGLKNKPEAHYDNGLALAISAKADLEPSVSTIANSRLDLAGAIARQDTFSPVMRVQAAGVAAEAGLLEAAEHRKLYKALVEMEGFSPRTPLEVAINTVKDESSDNGAKARTLRAALRTAKGNPARYSAVSRLLLDDIKALQPGEETERMTLDFIYASLAANAPEEALRWVSGASPEDTDPFERAWLGGVLQLAGVSLPEDAAENIVTALIAEAKTAQQKQAVTRLLVLQNAIGLPLAKDERGFLAKNTVEDTGKTISPFLLASMSAAADEKAGAEVILRLIKLTEGDAYKLAPQDAAVLVKVLRVLGQEDAARLLAMEATGYWRKSL